MNNSTSFTTIRWYFKMAWRDSRRNRSRLLLFMSSIILGIAALVAINSFGDNLQNDISRQAKELLGADLVIESRASNVEIVNQMMDSLNGKMAIESSFASMIFFPENEGTRLVHVRALEGNFPFYGEIETTPATASESFKKGRRALVDQTVMLQFNARPGDSVKIGDLNFLIEGAIIKVPGQSGIAATAAPPVFIPLEYLKETGLLQKGSRIEYKYYFKLNENIEVEKLAAQLEPQLDENNLRYDTVESRKEDVGRTFEDLANFLNLVAFVALLLGCVGVSSAIHIYMKDKMATVAVLRCLGVKGTQATYIYLVQILAIGLIGSIAGALLGTFIQMFLPQLFQEFLPVAIDLSVSWSAIIQGIALGIIVSLLFALLPLSGIRNISPLRTLRASFEAEPSGMDAVKWIIITSIVLFVFIFSWWQLNDWEEALSFTGFVAASFLFLTGAGKLIMWMVRKYFPVSWNYIWRQSLANLFRPNNQTLILTISIGLGTALITTLYFIQSLLINQVSISGSGNLPNMVLFDIQTDQKEEIALLTKEFDLPVMQQVPIVSMRIAAMKGMDKETILEDTTKDISRGSLSREYRVTYRDSLISSETLIEGKLQDSVRSRNDSTFISIEERMAERLHLKMGDPVTFNVQGAPIKTYVGSIREVDWRRVQTNFMIVFPKGVLEKAPQFHVLITKVKSKAVSADFQRTVVKNYPNISIIDLNLILDTLDDILSKVSFVIRFMALFSIFTGLLVLVSSVIISKFQRIQESILLRTLGAKRKQILQIVALEYFFLGSLASFSGIILALIASYALAYFNFETTFIPDLKPMLAVYLIITGITVIVGTLNNRGVVNKPPLEVLRSEV